MKARITRYLDAHGQPYYQIEGVHHTIEEVLCRHGERELEVEVDLDSHPERKAAPSEVHSIARPRLQAR